MKVLESLRVLLHRRLEIIRDHAWRDRDSVGHLAALEGISTEISTWTAKHRIEVDAQLRHYLGNASYSKALEHLDRLTKAAQEF